MTSEPGGAAYRNITEPRRIEIVYRDSKGKVTTREIIPAEIHWTPGLPRVQIIAQCLLRGGKTRSFMNDQILSAIDLDTDATIEDLGKHLRERY